jgi:ureidoacrylate peracid hydrolase
VVLFTVGCIRARLTADGSPARLFRQPEEAAMHIVSIPRWAVERVIERCGSAHPYADLDPVRTALIVVDLQNGFMVEGVAHALCRAAVDVVPNVNRLAAAVRRAGGKVVWIQTKHDPCWVTMYAKMRPEKAAKRIESMSEGSVGHQLYPALDVLPGDSTVQKSRFSAFLPDSSDLAERLRAVGCDTVLIAGTMTNVCCESSARDAMMMNFHTVMVSDANSAASDEEHNASLVNFYVMFGDVMDTDFLIGCLERNGAPREAAA